MTSPRLRTAGPDDAEQVARLHADSWRRHYRGAYADSYLDGDVVTDRHAVWSARLAAPGNAVTVVADDDTGLVGFGHVVFDEDDQWGSLLDNLHVTHARQRTGVGAAILTWIGKSVVEQARNRSMYLWVLEQNTSAQSFYAAFGGTCVEKTPVSAPGGVPTRLNGAPHKLRVTWPDASSLARATAD